METYSPSETLIDRKLKYKEDIFLVVFGDGTEIPCRVLTYGEFRAYRDLLTTQNVAPYIVWEDIYQKVVLDTVFRDTPDDDLRAGIITSTARAIYKLSAPGSYQDLAQSFDIYRANTMGLEEQMKVIVCHYFPGYKLSDLDDCSFNVLMRLFAGAEFLIKSKTWIEDGSGFSFADPSAQKEEENGTISNRELAQHNTVVNRG